MKAVFKNGEAKTCTSPIEQKVFRSQTAAGWLLLLTLTAEMTSAQLDDFLTPENISDIAFAQDDGTSLFSIAGYSKVSSAIIRYSENTTDTRVELQLMKELKADAEN